LLTLISLEMKNTFQLSFEILDFDFSPIFSREKGREVVTAWALLGTEDGDALEVDVDLIDLCAYLQTKGLIDDFYTVNKNGQKEFIIEFGGGSVVEWSPSKQDAIERFHNTCTMFAHNLTDIVTLQQLEAYFNDAETILKYK
jgi:hypothetical protein